MSLAEDLRLTTTPPSASYQALVGVDATRVDWLRAYALRLVVLDTAILALVGSLAVTLRFRGDAALESFLGVSYFLGTIALVPIWLAVLALSRCYETRFLGNGSEEFKRVGNASFRVVALVVFALFVTKTDASRGVVIVALFGGLTGLLMGRYYARLWLHRQRRQGACMHRVVVVGTPADALEMTTTLQSQPLAGLHVVGACIRGDARVFSADSQIPVLGELSEVVPVLQRLQADTVVIAKGHGIGPDELRQLSHELEGSGVDLLVSPQLTNVAGTRISWRTMPGLALLHVDEPELDGSRRLVKYLFDLVVGSALLLLSAPVLVLAALAIKFDSPGPVMFRQERVGRSGATFRIWKLRSMSTDAEAKLGSLTPANVHGDDGVLFKIHEDPRITRVGRVLRRYSLDELPQLFNVLRGQMSLVGPRPPLPQEVARYDGQTQRRLLVKPGMTGLWQVSGRSDLDWEESVRLDLHYVENWSLGLDISVLVKTGMAVVKSSGAY